jgi:DNA polymerase III delta prime subunit
MQTIPQFKLIPKSLLQSIIGISAGDIRSAINCTALVAMQLHHSPRLKADISMFVVSRILLIHRLAGLECRGGGLDLFHAAGRIVYNKRSALGSEV